MAGTKAATTLAILGVVLLSACSADSQGGGSAAVPDGDRPGSDGTGSSGGSAGGIIQTPAPGVEQCMTLADLGLEIAEAEVEPAEFPWDRPDPAVLEGFDFDRIIPGGPPPDGIRPIDEPCFDNLAGARRWLQGHSPVLVVEVEGDARAYPLAIMTQHEIVNDVIGDEPVVVTYCPLCNSGLAFERTVDGRVLSFGTSGRLYQSNLVMYDRQTKTLWSQFAGRAVVGEAFLGTELERLPTALVGFDEFAEAHLDGLVLSPLVFPARQYGRNPYRGYEDRADSFLYEGPRDDRIDPNSRVVGLGADEDPVAVTLAHLREDRVVEVEVAGLEVVLVWGPGQASALDTFDIDEGRDVGSTGAFVPVAPDGTRLTFQPADGSETTFVDDQTGSTWNLLGEATDGPLTGTQLEPVVRDDTFWFVWFAFQPETELIGVDAGG